MQYSLLSLLISFPECFKLPENLPLFSQPSLPDCRLQLKCNCSSGEMHHKVLRSAMWLRSSLTIILLLSFSPLLLLQIKCPSHSPQWPPPEEAKIWEQMASVPNVLWLKSSYFVEYQCRQCKVSTYPFIFCIQKYDWIMQLKTTTTV